MQITIFKIGLKLKKTLLIVIFKQILTFDSQVSDIWYDRQPAYGAPETELCFRHTLAACATSTAVECFETKFSLNTFTYELNLQFFHFHGWFN